LAENDKTPNTDRASRTRTGLAIGAGVMGAVTASIGIVTPAQAVDYPSWNDVQQAKSSVANQQAMVSNITALIGTLQSSVDAANVAAANYHGALAALDLAELNLAHATVRAPVSGYVTHLRLRPGDYATAGETKVAIVDAHSFWVVGYFEETRLRHIHVGDAAQVVLMGYEPVITGHVESIGHGIGDSNDETGGLGLPDIEPTFSWVRLAQRVPVRIHIDKLPEGVELVSGLSASVAVGRKSGDSQP